MKETLRGTAGLDRSELKRIEDFQTDFNAIERFLREELAVDSVKPFSYLVEGYARRYKGWNDAAVLKSIGDLRNAIVHERTEPYRYVAVPTENVVLQLRQIRGRLTDPPLAISRYAAKVVTVSYGDSLGGVLKLVKAHDFSQFPLFEGMKCRGLLTENGITRWLAQRVDAKDTLLELEEVLVKEVVGEEEKRDNLKIVGRKTRVDYVESLFSTNALLEGVLITETGKDTEKPLGIVTRWDMSSAR